MTNTPRHLLTGILHAALFGALLLPAAPRAEAQALTCTVRFASAQPKTTTSTAEETMYTVNVPGNQLSADGHFIDVAASGKKASNGNPQTHGVRFGPTTVLATSTATAGIDYVWRVRIYFRDSTTCTQNSQVQRGPNVLAGRSTTFTCDPTVLNAVSLVATTPTQAGDVTFNDFTVTVCN